MTVLLLGAAGFVGRAIAQTLAEHSIPVHGTVRRPLQHVSPISNSRVDLTRDASELRSLLCDLGVTHLVHAAAPPREMLAKKARALEYTRRMEETICGACADVGSLRRLILVGSGAVYGDRIGGACATEEDPRIPTSFYGEAKLEQENFWTAAAVARELTIVRPFNITGPGEPSSLMCAATAERLASLPAEESLSVRNSESVRDYVDVRDVAAAVLAAILSPSAGTFNVCSGTPVRVRTVAELLVDLSKAGAPIKFDGCGVQSRSCGSPAHAHAALGWRPRYRLVDSLAAVWEEASVRVAALAQ